MSALPSTQIEIRALARGEVSEVARIESEVYAFPWTLGNFIDSINAGHSCWACTVNGRLAGYAVILIAANEAHLLNISIANEWQGRGIGTQFLQHLLRVAKPLAGIMFLEVRPSNANAQRLYEREGFQRIALRPKYYPSFEGREDAIIYARNL
ncbi:MAG: [Ribosomal protein S18]-alanine N-acetyltransferase [Pseudomonadota bacterium]|jgi:[ribosomal protein S18]-alanine N-acetyltransferase